MEKYTLCYIVPTTNKENYELAQKLRRETKLTQEEIYMRGVKEYLKEIDMKALDK